MQGVYNKLNSQSTASHTKKENQTTQNIIYQLYHLFEITCTDINIYLRELMPVTSGYSLDISEKRKDKLYVIPIAFHKATL